MITEKRVSCIFFLLVAACVIACLFSTTPAWAQNQQVDLSATSLLCGGQECFNADGIFATGTTFLGTAFMDGATAGNCTAPPPFTGCPDAYSAQTLGLSSTTLPTLTPASVGVPFTFGAVNTVDCGPSTSNACILDTVNLAASPGVVITLPAAQQAVYSTLIMLGSAVDGSHAGQVTATYTSGAPDVFSQTFSDWCGFTSNKYESIAVGPISHMRINADGSLNGATCSIYAYTYPLDFTRTLQSITLTDADGSGAMFAFAITLKPPSYSLSGGAATPPSMSAGATSTATVTVIPQPGYPVTTPPVNGTATVTLKCVVAPTIVATSGATPPTCVANPTQVTVTAGETAPPTTQLTFTTVAPAKAMAESPRTMFYAFWLPIPALALIGFGLGSENTRRKKLFGMFLLLMVLAGLIATPACVSYKHLGNVGTPPGTYYLTVSGSDENGLTQAGSPVAVTVQVTQ